ncbi:MAG: hypothetical protein ACI9FB_003749 [Candidatus Azotimanducaceae bacterium]|jgi:hypothetical protein
MATQSIHSHNINAAEVMLNCVEDPNLKGLMLSAIVQYRTQDDPQSALNWLKEHATKLHLIPLCKSVFSIWAVLRPKGAALAFEAL